MQLSTFGTEFSRTKREGKVAESVVLSEVSGVSMAEGNDSLPRVLINQVMKFDDSLACFLIFRRVGVGMTMLTLSCGSALLHTWNRIVSRKSKKWFKLVCENFLLFVWVRFVPQSSLTPFNLGFCDI